MGRGHMADGQTYCLGVHLMHVCRGHWLGILEGQRWHAPARSQAALNTASALTVEALAAGLLVRKHAGHSLAQLGAEAERISKAARLRARVDGRRRRAGDHSRWWRAGEHCWRGRARHSFGGRGAGAGDCGGWGRRALGGRRRAGGRRAGRRRLAGGRGRLGRGAGRRGALDRRWRGLLGCGRGRLEDRRAGWRRTCRWRGSDRRAHDVGGPVTDAQGLVEHQARLAAVVGTHSASGVTPIKIPAQGGRGKPLVSGKGKGIGGRVAGGGGDGNGVGELMPNSSQQPAVWSGCKCWQWASSLGTSASSAPRVSGIHVRPGASPHLPKHKQQHATQQR